MHYIVAFTTYTLAMLGIIFIGFVVTKKCLNMGISGSKNNFLSVESSLCIEPRKNLYVIKAGAERFLISTSSEGSNLLTKLEEGNEVTQIQKNVVKSVDIKEPENSFEVINRMPFNSPKDTSFSNVSDLPDTYFVNRVLNKLDFSSQNSLG